MGMLVQEQSTGSSVPFRAWFTQIRTHTVISGTLIQWLAGKQKASLLVPSPAICHLTDLLENITRRERAAIMQQSDKSTRNDSSVRKAQRASDEQSASAWQHYLCYMFASVCVALLAKCKMSRQTPVISCLAHKSSTSLLPVSSSIGAHLGQNTHTRVTIAYALSGSCT